MENKITAIGTPLTRAHRAELSAFIAHHQGLAMLNLELGKATWNPWKRSKYLHLSNYYAKEAAKLLDEYRNVWKNQR